MTLTPHSQCSCHFHGTKQETFILVSGTMNIEVTNLSTGAKEVLRLQNPGDSITLKPYVPHSFYCDDSQIENTIFVECSTEDDPSDSYRFNSSTADRNNR